MDQNQLKQQVANAAVNEILQLVPQDQIIGMGTGSTVNFLIEALAPHKNYFKGIVSSSLASTKLLETLGFEVLEANEVDTFMVYVDGADEINANGQMIKGGGGALTREKIIASMAQTFICICDASKQVDVLGEFPLPVEVIPLAASKIGRFLTSLGAKVQLRASKNDPQKIFVTDNGGWILDAENLKIQDPKAMEILLNQEAGVICNGIFAKESADILLVSSPKGVSKVTWT